VDGRGESVTAIRAAPPESAPFPAAHGFGQAPPPRRPRNLAGALLGLLLIVFCAVAVALYVANVGHRRAVLVVTRPIKAGGVIHAADLGEVRVAADPSVHTVAASQRDRIVGQVAGVSLAPGTLVNRAELEGGPAIGPGQAVIGLSLKPGQFPAGLRAPDQVMVVDAGPAAGGTSGPSGIQPAPTVVIQRAEVESVDLAPDGQATVVSIMTSEGEAPAVAAAGSRGSVSLVLLGGTGP
jgi:hypothetical protein